MNLQVKNYILILALLTILGITFVSGWVSGRRTYRSELISSVYIQNSVINSYVYRVGELEKEVSQHRQTIAKQREVIRSGEISKAELDLLHMKSISEITALRGKVKVLSDSIKHSGVIFIDTCGTEEPNPYIVLPFDFRDSTQYYDVWGGFDTVGNMSLGMEIPVELDIVSGKDPDIKGNYKVMVTSLNPFVNIEAIKSYKFDVPKEKRFGLRFVTGYGIGLRDFKLQPIICIGVS